MATSFAEVEDRVKVSLEGVVLRVSTVKVGGVDAFLVLLRDAVPAGGQGATGSGASPASGSGSAGRTARGTLEIDLLFLGRATINGISEGVRCHVEGTARFERGRMVAWNPLYRIEPGRIEPGRG